MMAIIKSIIYLATYATSAPEIRHICDMPHNHLKPHSQISFVIGCQKDKFGRRLYSPEKLKEVYNE